MIMAGPPQVTSYWDIIVRRAKDHLDAESKILEIEDFRTGNYLQPLPLLKPKSCSENKFVEKVVNIPKPTGCNRNLFLLLLNSFIVLMFGAVATLCKSASIKQAEKKYKQWARVMSGLKSYLFWMKYFDIETVPVQSIIAVVAVGPPHHSMVPLPRIVLDLFCREMPPPPYFLRQEMSPPPFFADTFHSQAGDGGSWS